MISPYNPFSQNEVIGVLDWTVEVSKRTGFTIYHGCHHESLQSFINFRPIPLVSKWKWIDSNQSVNESDGLWCSFNRYPDNYFGPFEFHFPVDALNGRRFLVIQRCASPKHCILLETPIDSPHNALYKKTTAITVDKLLVQGRNGKPTMEPNEKIDIVVVESLPIENVKLWAVEHSKCELGKCKGVSEGWSSTFLRRLQEKAKVHPKYKDRYQEIEKMVPSWQDHAIDIDWDSWLS